MNFIMIYKMVAICDLYFNLLYIILLVFFTLTVGIHASANNAISTERV